MKRRSFLATTACVGASGFAGCLDVPKTRSHDQADGTMDDENSIAPGTWPQAAYDSRKTRHVSSAIGPHDDATIEWSALGDRPYYPPVVDEYLYLTDAWANGTAVAVSPTDGTIQRSNAGPPPMRWAPALHENRLLVISRNQENVIRLHALDTETGDEAWVQEAGVTASSGTGFSGPTIRGDVVYLGSSRGVIALDARTGDVKWEATLGPHVDSTGPGGTKWDTNWAMPTVTDELVFTFDTNDSYDATRTVYALNRSTGDQEWTAELLLGHGWFLKGYVVAGSEYVFVSALEPESGGGGSGEGGNEWSGTERLFALEAATGNLAWKWELPRKTRSPPAFADGTLFVGEWYPDRNTGRLHAVAASDGKVDWSYRTQTGAVRSPTVAGDTIYIAQDKEVTAVTTEDGTERWQLNVGDRPGPPVVIDDSLYILTNSGRGSASQLHAIRSP